MGLISRMALGVATLVGSLCSKQAADEFKAWTPWMVEGLIVRASKRFPDDRERLLEEWRGRVFEIPGEVGKLWFALTLQVNAEELQYLIEDRILAYLYTIAFIPFIFIVVILISITYASYPFVKVKLTNGKQVYFFKKKGRIGLLLEKSAVETMPAIFHFALYGSDGYMHYVVKHTIERTVSVLRWLRSGCGF